MIPKCKDIEESCVAVSPTQPETNEKVWLQKGKNLLKLEETSKTLNGVTMTINSDGSITLNGTATDNTLFIISKQKIKLIGDYTFGITTDFSAIGHGFEVGGYVYGADGQYKYNISTNQPTKTLSDGEYISNFNIYFSSGAVFNNFVIYPQLEQGSTATEYEAYIDKKIYCKNDNGVFEEFVNVEDINGSNWKELELLTNWENLGSNYFTAQYKKIGNQIFLRGIVKNTIDSGRDKEILLLPEDIRPKKTAYVVLNMNDTFLSAYINTNGYLLLSNYTAGNWIDVSNANYFID